MTGTQETSGSVGVCFREGSAAGFGQARTTATKTALVKGGANRPDVPRSRLRR